MTPTCISNHVYQVRRSDGLEHASLVLILDSFPYHESRLRVLKVGGPQMVTWKISPLLGYETSDLYKMVSKTKSRP